MEWIQSRYQQKGEDIIWKASGRMRKSEGRQWREGRVAFSACPSEILLQRTLHVLQKWLHVLQKWNPRVPPSRRLKASQSVSKRLHSRARSPGGPWFSRFPLGLPIRFAPPTPLSPLLSPRPRPARAPTNGQHTTYAIFFYRLYSTGSVVQSIPSLLFSNKDTHTTVDDDRWQRSPLRDVGRVFSLLRLNLLCSHLK
jgi:hypothetical protein